MVNFENDSANVAFYQDQMIGIAPLPTSPPRRLKSLFQRDVPESSFDIEVCFLVAILNRAGAKWRIQIENIIHAERDRGAIEPRFPSTGTKFRRGDWHDIFVATRAIDMFTTILGNAGHLSLRHRSSDVKSIRDYRVHRRPFANFARKGVRSYRWQESILKVLNGRSLPWPV
jgi:hypothetical protein